MNVNQMIGQLRKLQRRGHGTEEAEVDGIPRMPVRGIDYEAWPGGSRITIRVYPYTPEEAK